MSEKTSSEDTKPTPATTESTQMTKKISSETTNNSTTPATIPTCPICISFLCEPLRTSCNHLFCRACLLQTTQLSPDGRACPLCRAPIQMEDPKTHPIDRTVENIIRENVLSSEYELRLSSARTVIKQLEERARTTLPIFYMAPGCSVGQLIALHLFEPRYRILIRRAMEGNKMFVYCSKTPKRGIRAVLVQVTIASFMLGGRANVQGVGVEEFVMGDVWVEDGTAGLYYTRFEAKPGGIRPNSNSNGNGNGNRNENRSENETKQQSRSCILS